MKREGAQKTCTQFIPIYPTEFRVELLSLHIFGAWISWCIPEAQQFGIGTSHKSHASSAFTFPNCPQLLPSPSLPNKSSKLLLPTVAKGVFGLSEYQLLLLAFVARLEQVDASENAHTHHQAMHGDRLRRFLGVRCDWSIIYMPHCCEFPHEICNLRWQ